MKMIKYTLLIENILYVLLLQTVFTFSIINALISISYLAYRAYKDFKADESKDNRSDLINKYKKFLVFLDLGDHISNAAFKSNLTDSEVEIIKNGESFIPYDIARKKINLIIRKYFYEEDIIKLADFAIYKSLLMKYLPLVILLILIELSGKTEIPKIINAALLSFSLLANELHIKIIGGVKS